MILTRMKHITPDGGRSFYEATVEHEGERVTFTNRLGSWMHEQDGRLRETLPEVAAYLQEELRIHDATAVQDRRKIKAVVVSAEAMGEAARAESSKERRRRPRAAA